MLAIGKHRLWPCLLADDLCFLWERHISSIHKRRHEYFYLENGIIAEQGTHQQLVDRKGKYYELIKNQLELES